MRIFKKLKKTVVTDKIYGLQVDEREEVYMCVYAFISLGYVPGVGLLRQNTDLVWL